MTTYELDPDVVRWGLHLLDNCSLSNLGSCGTVTQREPDLSNVEYVREGYFQEQNTNVENDEVIAYALQEEFSRLATDEASGTPNSEKEHTQTSSIAQDWLGPSKRLCTSGDLTNFPWNEMQLADNYPSEKEKESNEAGEIGIPNSYSSPGEESLSVRDVSHLLSTSDGYVLDGELDKTLNPMVPIPHVPKINGELPSYDEEISDHQRLLQRLELYDLVEVKVKGDGNCQFRALSDQLYGSPDHHKFVREQIVKQLKSHQEMYDGYVPMAYTEYLKKMSKNGEWGDHVTLQAAADWYGVKIFVITSFKDTCYIEILPHTQKSERIILLSFWAEVHYNSIYHKGDQPIAESKKKKWWMFGC